MKRAEKYWQDKTQKTIDKTGKNDEANKLLPEFRKIDRALENVELVYTKTDGTKYDLRLPLEFIEKIYDYEITLDEAIEDKKN